MSPAADAAQDAAFTAWVEEARAVSVADVLERRGISLRRAGTELVGPCPVCGGTDRFGVNLRRNIWCCRKAGRGGDAIALVEYLDGANFLGACETLTGVPAPRGEGQRLSAEELAARAQERRAAEAKREASHNAFRERERRTLWAHWRTAWPPAGTPVEAYLGRRSIGLPPGGALRFLPDMPFWHGSVEDERGAKVGRIIHRGPAMLAAIIGADDTFAGLHITWLDLAQPKGKALVFDPDTGEELPAKKVRGSLRGGRLWLVRGKSEGEVTRQISGEGIETTLSAWEAMAREGRAAGIDFVAGISLGNLAGAAAASVMHPTVRTVDKAGRSRPTCVPGPVSAEGSAAMHVPARITHLILLGDGDSDPFTTRCAMDRAVSRHAAPGRLVTVAWPPEGFDFNDVLLGRHLSGRAA
ncbi:DNA primase [Aquabacter sp. L1I39]|uniref:DUF7146 domain-containing protein n=1 Tax=Aquabacter sp. L1I39 TaxID=2820278 RepID=UPI001ADB4876|nr:CHC2 zinc finger domain-containing protein [Aquabacter sp. L1I39]QTL01928.1 DNA primase [Aquabacter sp. L1I39]